MIISLTKKQILDLNRMNVSSQRAKIGDILAKIPITESHVIVNSNMISDGHAVVMTLDNNIDSISSFFVIGQGGIKKITTFEAHDNMIMLASTEIVVNDTLVVTYIPKIN